ncbi:hypothetical protein AB0O95_04440 [Rhodoglobus sp. NPDC076762]
MKWGSYEDRYFVGLVLIFAGAVHLQGANPYTLLILLIGTVSTVVGWSIMPAKGWRRMAVAVPAVAQIWIMLTGPMSMWTLAIPLLCWLIVRHRPLISYVALAIPVVNGIVIAQLYRDYAAMPQTLAISAVAVVVAAWVAQLIAQSAAKRH